MATLKKRLTIGFLTDQLDEQFHRLLWTGVDNVAKEHDVNLIVYSGKCLRAGLYFEYNENIVFGMVNFDRLDGILLSSGSLGNFISKKNYAAFVEYYRKKPLVSLYVLLEGIPSICVDSKNGMKAVINHLIEVHGFKRIAYIKGLENNIDAEIRWEAYVEALQEHDIPLDENLVLPGDFSVQSGEKAMRILLDERKAKCEAIVAANDGMALGALHILKERGINVPRDVALTGFDGLEDTQFSSPPLTSVQQPVRQIAKKGTEMLLDLIAGGKVPEKVSFDAIPVIRYSCGCLPMPKKIIKENMSSSAKKNYKPAVNKKNHMIIAKKVCERLSVPESKREKYTDYIENLLERFFNGIAYNKEISAFLTFLNEVLTKTIIKEDEAVSWQDIIYLMRSYVMTDLSRSEDAMKADELFHQAQILTGKTYELKEGLQKYIRSQQDASLRSFLTIVVHSVVELEKLLPIIAQAIEHFGIYRCFLSLFEDEVGGHIDPTKWNVRNRSRLLLSVMGNKADIYSENGPLFPSIDLIPDKYIPEQERFSWMVRILYFREMIFGSIIFDLNTRAENVLVTLHDIFCSGIMITNLFKKRVIAEDTLKARTRELEESNKKLEKLDDLKNDFIANITHDFRSSLMIILNTAELGLKYEKIKNALIQKWFSNIHNASIKLKTKIDKLLELGKMDAQGVKLNISKVNIKKFLESIVDFYKSTIENTHIKIIGNLPSGDIDNIYTDTEKLEEVLHNLLSNALKYVDPIHGTIEIECVDRKESVRIIIKDNGIGIPPNKLKDIFKRFVQIDEAKGSRFKGTGIGLAFSKQLVGFLKGKIWAESDGIGKGARFIVELYKGKKIFRKEDFSDKEVALSAITQDRESLSHLLQMEINEKEKKEGFSVLICSMNNEEEYDYRKGVILIVEDNEYIRDIEQEYLERAGYMNFVFATDGKSGINAAYTYRPDIIICDYNMPKMKGNEFHDKIASNPDFSSIPFIFLTAIANRELIIERRKKGAIAVLQKPLDENDFLLTVENSLKRYMSYRRTLKQAIVDELTGLYNRQTILRKLHDQLAIRSYRNLSLIFFDIDHFKQFNDVYGHQAGDKVLATVGNTVKTTIRNSDIAGRYGGEEFLIILPETTMNGAFTVAEKLKEGINAIPVPLHGKDILISSSFGISSLIENAKTICDSLDIPDLKDLYDITGNEKTDLKKIDKLKSKIVELLISLADQAMYRAKSTVCSSCGFSSAEETLFTSGQCPQCKKKSIIKGRNKIVLWED